MNVALKIELGDGNATWVSPIRVPFDLAANFMGFLGDAVTRATSTVPTIEASVTNIAFAHDQMRGSIDFQPQIVAFVVEAGAGLDQKKALNATWNKEQIRILAAQVEKERGLDADEEE